MSMVFCGYSGFLHYDITEILLKVTLNIINPNPDIENKQQISIVGV
jgi:hypothetical protein